MTDELKLRACPFCGSAAMAAINNASHRNLTPSWAISCPRYCVTMSRKTKKAVTVDWNRRAQPELRWCKHCGEGTVAGLCRGTGRPVEAEKSGPVSATSEPVLEPLRPVAGLDQPGVTKMVPLQVAIDSVADVALTTWATALEECAKLCDDVSNKGQGALVDGAEECADAIRELAATKPADPQATDVPKQENT